jgi:signal peptidase I
MKRSVTSILLSLLMPGMGYLYFGDTRKFNATIILFYSAVISGAVFRLYPEFLGFITVTCSLAALHIYTAIHAAFGNKRHLPESKRIPKLILTMALVLSTITGFSHSQTVMGFDRVSMAVPVMEPTIIRGDQVLVDTWIYRSEKPKRGDIVLHSFTGQPGLYVNRIIAIPGDEIEILNGKVYVNGITSVECYVDPGNVAKMESLAMKSVRVPAHHYFVLGDNRDKSFGDSRFNGPIGIKDIVGKVISVLYSGDYSRIGKSLKHSMHRGTNL